MAEDALIGERAYHQIKAWVTGGRFLPGERLHPPRLKEDTGASLTTIYNALRRLAIERLVETGPHEGFHALADTEAQLRGLYRWVCALTILAVRNAAPVIGGAHIESAPAEADTDSDMVVRTEAFHDAIAALPEIAECREAMAHASDRLRAVRKLEGYVIAEREGELAALQTATGEPDRLVALLEAYRDRRLAAVPDLMRLRARPADERPPL